MIIAIDAMGGDLAPTSNVKGAIEAAREMPDVRIVLVGDEARLAPMLAQAPKNIEIRHAAETIEADEEPVKAVRRKRDSSLVLGVTMVKKQRSGRYHFRRQYRRIHDGGPAYHRANQRH